MITTVALTAAPAAANVAPPVNDWRNQDMGFLMFRGPVTTGWGHVFGANTTGRPQGYTTLNGACIAARMLSKGDERPAVGVLEGNNGRFFTQQMKYDADTYGINPLQYEHGWPVFPNSRKAEEIVHYANVDLRAVYDGTKKLGLSNT